MGYSIRQIEHPPRSQDDKAREIMQTMTETKGVWIGEKTSVHILFACSTYYACINSVNSARSNRTKHITY